MKKSLIVVCLFAVLTLSLIGIVSASNINIQSVKLVEPSDGVISGKISISVQAIIVNEGNVDENIPFYVSTYVNGRLYSWCSGKCELNYGLPVSNGLKAGQSGEVWWASIASDREFLKLGENEIKFVLGFEGNAEIKEKSIKFTIQDIALPQIDLAFQDVPPADMLNGKINYFKASITNKGPSVLKNDIIGVDTCITSLDTGQSYGCFGKFIDLREGYCAESECVLEVGGITKYIYDDARTINSLNEKLPKGWYSVSFSIDDVNGLKNYEEINKENSVFSGKFEMNQDTNLEQVKEQVKCVFDGSTQLQKCYTAEQNSRAYCSGVESCITSIFGYRGEQITWKSTCGGYDYTTIDGVDNNVDFDCKNIGICQSNKCDDGTIPECKIDNGQCICKSCPPIIIKPVCGNGICESGEGEICKTTEVMCEVGKECKAPPSECFVVCPQDCKPLEPLYPNLNEKFKLQIYQPAKIVENENHVMKITFKDLILSQCGEIQVSSEAAETIESKVAIATGMVVASTDETPTITPSTSSGGGGGTVPSTPTTTTPITTIIQCNSTTMPIAVLGIDIIVNSQISTSTILNLNLEEKKQVGDFAILFVSYDYASRTGTFLVTRETFFCPKNCKCDENGKTIVCVSECEKGKTLCPDGICRDKCSIMTEDCKYGCSYDGKCFPMGVRSSGMYCGVDLNMNSQLKSDEKCENNFECSSNVCVSGKCISEGLIQKILSWFKRLFGG